MSMRIHTIEHVPSEGPGAIKDWAEQNAHRLSRTFIFQDRNFPSVSDLDCLVILGGPMNADEDALYPWLLDEKKFIRKTIEAGKTVVGICLGSQLIAQILGAKVTKNPYKEIGWFPIRLTPQSAEMTLFKDQPREFTPLHWHGDTFAIPQNAVKIAESQACANQGFVYRDRVVGLQFHIEVTLPMLKDWAENMEEKEDIFVQSRDALISLSHLIPQSNQILFDFLDRLSLLKSKKEL